MASADRLDLLKEKLWRKTGTAVASMHLKLHDETGAKVADLDRDAAPLTSYSSYNGSVHPYLASPQVLLLPTTPLYLLSSLDLMMACVLQRYRLHIIDLDPSSLTSGGWLEDNSLVEKYTISDEAYDKLGSKFKVHSVFS